MLVRDGHRGATLSGQFVDFVAFIKAVSYLLLSEISQQFATYMAVQLLDDKFTV